MEEGYARGLVESKSDEMVHWEEAGWRRGLVVKPDEWDVEVLEVRPGGDQACEGWGD